MSAFAYLPAIPRPPHDPTSMRLGGGQPWRIEGRGKDEPLRLPSLVPLDPLAKLLPKTAALDSYGRLLLLTPNGLLVFDPCECRFLTVPGFPALVPANALAVGRSRIVAAADAVRSFSARSFAPAGSLPGSPSDVAFDRRGRLVVADPAAGTIVRGGETWGGLGAVERAIVDDEGALFAYGGGALIPLTGKSKPDLACRIAEQEAYGVRFDGGVLTFDCGKSFDLEGNEVPTPAPVSTTLATSATLVTEPLDSDILRCEWHRIVMDATCPPGGAVRIRTFAADVTYLPFQIAALPEEAWGSDLVLRPQDAPLDALLRRAMGRYLYLRIDLKGNGRTTPEIKSLDLEFPRISLRRYLPAVFGSDPVSAEFTDRLLSIYDTGLRSIEQEIDAQARLYDPMATPAEFLSWLGGWIGVPLDRQWPELKRRQILKSAASRFDVRGTLPGLRRLLIALFDLDRALCQPKRERCDRRERTYWDAPPLVLEHFKLRRWLFLGTSRLGDQAVLWGRAISNRTQLDGGAVVGQSQLRAIPDPQRDPLLVHANRLTIFAPVSRGQTPERRKAIENVVRSEVPASVDFDIRYVGPRFRIGIQSMVGLDTVVGRIPRPEPLGDARLGATTILGGDSQGTRGLRVG